MKVLNSIFKYSFVFLIKLQLVYCSITIGFGVIGALSATATYYKTIDKFITCKVTECCKEEKGTGWIPNNLTAFHEKIQHKVYGQHLVDKIVLTALKSHISDEQPSKALVMSFHGWTGSGKNYVARFVAESLYYKGMDSKYVHLFVSTVNFPHEDQVDIYRLQIQDWIRGNVSYCERSLFIFDEIDKMPTGMIDAIKPFIDYHDNIFGVDFRKSIFIFLSNTGSREINKKVLQLWRQGRERMSISLIDMEDIVEKGAFNEKGGLHNSDLIQHSLVDFFVPFLPLERRHVESCVRDEIIRRKRKPTEEIIQKVVSSLIFFPPESQLFSSTGCKRISSKVGYFLADEKYESIFD